MNTALRSYLCLIGVAGLIALHAIPGHSQETAAIAVKVKQVRETTVERTLPLSGRVYSRNDAAMSLTLAGELEWVLEPGIHVAAGEVIAQLDQAPILLRKTELQHLTERERVNAVYLDKELARLRRLKIDSNASERQVDEGESRRDISRLVLRSLQARIDQLDDEIRRSRLVAPFDAVIAQRSKRGGEYVQPGNVIVRLVDLANLELRFQMPVVYHGRLAQGDTVIFIAQSRRLSGETPAQNDAIVRAVIAAANPNSQTVEVRADIDPTALTDIIAGQLVNISVPISGNKSTVQIPRDAIVLRAEGNYVFRISADNTAQKIMVEVGEGSLEWVSVRGKLNDGDWVAIRGVERLQDGQQVSRRES